MKAKITQALVERVSAVTDKTTLYADPELRGFYLIVSKSKKGFYVQSLVNGKQVRVKLGDHPSLTAKAARELAMQTLVTRVMVISGVWKQAEGVAYPVG